MEKTHPGKLYKNSIRPKANPKGGERERGFSLRCIRWCQEEEQSSSIPCNLHIKKTKQNVNPIDKRTKKKRKKENERKPK